MMHNPALQPTANPLRGLSAAELGRYASWRGGMAHSKFDETDRRAVIDELSRRLDVRISRVGRRRKWLRDHSGRNYWVLGGYADWHGIPEEMMDAEIADPSGGLVVIAMRRQSDMEIFLGPLAPLVAARRKLSRANQSSGDYQFTFRRRGGHLFVDQDSSVTLSSLVSFSFDETEKESAKRVEETMKLFAALPEDEQRELFKKLLKKLSG